MPSISPQQWSRYHEEGYLRLGKVLDDTTIEGLNRRLDDIMLGRVAFDGDMQVDKAGAYAAMGGNNKFAGPTLAYSKIQDLERDPVFRAYIEMPVFREICAHEYGKQASISCFGAMFMDKPVGEGAMLPWHQDGGVSWGGLDRDPVVTCWVALDRATAANGCLQIVPGSHKLGLLSRQGNAIPKDQEGRYCPPEKVLHVEMEAGEVVLLHNWVLHRSDVNKTTSRRRGFSVCYMDARTARVADGRTFPLVFGEDTPAAPEQARAGG
jgi:ectoine hydroxylase-related dioxygenase (phytanoyl-CoA dioxygenase family)